jgi:superfamily II DNA or RNA helicase
VCVVVDEAHKAQGDYAYCAVIKQLAAATRHFRVLALSATPGSMVFIFYYFIILLFYYFIILLFYYFIILLFYYFII